MAVKGATDNQIKQLEAKLMALKEQYQFAQKSIKRLNNMLKDSLIPQQTYDETFAKYQGALAAIQCRSSQIGLVMQKGAKKRTTRNGIRTTRARIRSAAGGRNNK